MKKEIHAILTPRIEIIIKKWGNHKRKPDQYIFPYLSGKESQMEIRVKAQDIIHRTNDRLKEIGKDLKIENLLYNFFLIQLREGQFSFLAD